MLFCLFLEFKSIVFVQTFCNNPLLDVEKAVPLHCVISFHSVMLEAIGLSFPLHNPTLIFGVVMAIILLAPLLLKRLHIPSIIVLILAGVALGPHGVHLIAHDESFELFGRVGLLYIMFLSGLEIDINDFKKNRHKSFVFGLYTFLIPMGLGIVTGMYILDFSFIASTLLASMYASHTLMAYPIVSRYGLSKNQSVNITIGGTMVTVTLSLIILAAITGMYKGTVDAWFWVRFLLMSTLFCIFVLFAVPKIASWFFKRYHDSILQYSFVLGAVALSSYLAELAGLEGILGAFLVGLSLNKLIPNLSPLMNRINFVGNALFIPFFLISVGMLVNLRVFVQGWDTLLVALVMTIVATFSKWLAAYFTQKTFRMHTSERTMIFGLSNAQAAATLAAVMIGYGIILPDGSHLLNEHVLNGTIVMILITCAISSIVTEKASKRITEEQSIDIDESKEERILIPISNPNTCDNLIELSILMKGRKNTGMYALSVIHDRSRTDYATNLLEQAAKVASATDNNIEMVTCIEPNAANGIKMTAEQKNITDIIIGLHIKQKGNESVYGFIFDSLLQTVTQGIYIYHHIQPINTLKRLIVAVPPNAEKETGFLEWYERIRQLSIQLGVKVIFYASKESIQILHILTRQKQRDIVGAKFMELNDWEDFLIIAKNIKSNDMLVVVQARRSTASYHPLFDEMPLMLEKFFADKSFLVVYPHQDGTIEDAGAFFSIVNQSHAEDFHFIKLLKRFLKQKFVRRKSS